jgi:uncharacterized OB-fold protein
MADQKEKKYLKPLPVIDEETRPWWEALQRHELYVQKCRDCGDLRYHPRAQCTSCLSPRTEWVELDEGVKMLTNLVECRPEEAKIGMPVEVVYEDVTPQVTLAKFRPAR